jgi:dihydroflavonol-4-reductase
MADKVAAVTGASGFIASHIVKQLLEKGYTVHGTVRSLANKDKLNFLYKLPHADTHLKLFEADLLKSNAFEEAFKDTTVVYHTASPVVFASNDPQKDIIDPAVEGTLNALNSAAKYSSIKRVVVTGSVASLYDRSTPNIENTTFDESNWNTESTADRNPYYASKAEAERATWNFVEKNKDKISFDVVVILPTFVIGQVLQDANNMNQGSVDLILSYITTARDGKPIDRSGLGIIDVKDLAQIHILAGEAQPDNSEVSNNRIIADRGTFTVSDLVKILSNALPDEFISNVDYNNLSPEEATFKFVKYDSSKLKRAFPSFKLTDVNDTLVEFYTKAKENKLIN